MTNDEPRTQDAINAAIVGAALDCVIVIDQDGRVTRWNEAAERTFGYSSEEARARPLSELIIPGAYHQAHQQGLRRYLTTGEAHVLGRRVQLEAQRRDGSLFPCELAIHPVSVDGRTFFAAYLRDLTEQVQAFEAAREGEARYRALVEHVGVGVVHVAPDGRILEVNPMAQRILGYAREELLGMTMGDLTHPDDFQASHLDVLQMVQSGEHDVIRMEKHYVRKGGEIVCAAVTVSVVRGSQGEVLYTVTTIEDITQRKRAEQERARLARGVEESTDFIAFADLDNHLVYLNEAGRNLIGFEGPILEGLGVPDFVHPEDRPFLLNQAWPVIRSAGRWEGEMRFVHLRTGEPIPVHRTIFALTNPESGERFGYATVTRDIRERRRAEAERLAWQEDLERQVEQRTRELQTLNAELDAFSYSISHDLRAPIRHIASFAGLLRKTLGEHTDPRTQRYLGVIEDTSTRMNEMVNALLEFARHAREPLRLTRVDLNQLVHDARLELAVDAQDRRVTWRVEELPLVQGDPALLRQVMLNLLSNALKYTQPREEAVIQVSGRREEAEWVVRVQDNGVGFDARYADRLFGVFQRLHRPGEFEGIGIGLANVQRIVSRHGGRVWAESQPGQGATFGFSLPQVGR